MDLSFFYQPIVTSGILAAVMGGAIVVAAWRSKAVIAKALAQLRSKLFNRNGFFWTVNVIFMAVSVLHAGVFFGITGNGHDIPGVAQWLGFAVSFFLDLVTIILMQALLEARYRSDEPRAKQFLLFITICCSTSTFANLAISLNDFDPAKFLPHAPIWIQILAPYVLASFPLFVILMSVAAEMIINVRPLDSLNEEEYEADEKKRVKLLQIRNDYLQRQADEELRALTIRSQMQINKRLRGGKLPKSFRWFWEKPLDIDAVIAGVSAQLKASYEPQIEDLKRRLEETQTTILEISETSSEEPSEDLTGNNDAKETSENIQEIPSTPAGNEAETRTKITPFPAHGTSGKSPKKPKRKTQGNASGNNTEAAKRIVGILKRKPYIPVSELATKAKVSRGYASKKRAEFLEAYKPEISSAQ